MTLATDEEFEETFNEALDRGLIPATEILFRINYPMCSDRRIEAINMFEAIDHAVLYMWSLQHQIDLH